MKKISVVALVVLLLSAFPFSAGFAETIKGRDYAALGKFTTLRGTLVEEGSEWGLRNDSGVYDLHLGPSDFRAAQGIVLKDGASATVRGFTHERHVAVATIETGGKSVTLRDEAGRPAWAGTRFSKGGGKAGVSSAAR